jgi:signal peptidase I
MSPSSLDNGDSPAATANGRREHAMGGAASPTAAEEVPTTSGSDTRVRDDAIASAGAAVAATELDDRLRRLRVAPADDVPPPPGRPLRRRRRRSRRLAKTAAFVAVAAAAVLLLQAFVLQPFGVPGDAMAPTLKAGDRILVLKWGLLEGPVHTGEIVVLHPPRSLPCTVVGCRGGDLLLRVLALPGQEIRSAGNTILVNGRPLREGKWYDRNFGQVGSTPIRDTTLRPGQYFVMGDNRSDACDSRAFGPISKSSIVGEGIAVIGRQGHVVLGTL